jgi:hypothetical protein
MGPAHFKARTRRKCPKPRGKPLAGQLVSSQVSARFFSRVKIVALALQIDLAG